MSHLAWAGQAYPAFSVAPMLDVTDRHFRYFLRLLSRHTLLYSEMVTTGALLYGKQPERYLDFSAEEQPVALQLGGSDPKALAECAQRAEQWGYAEVNLNVGCPSDRVQNNKIGACLMAEPALVAACFQAMQAATSLPVTIKCRIGIDEQDEYQHLEDFIGQVAAAGCQIFIVHARKAWLKGLSPKENREVPPLNYQRVYQLKREHPDLVIALNGGLTDLDQCHTALEQVDSVMLGRAIWQHPWLLAQVDAQFFAGPESSLTQHQAIQAYLPYVEQRLLAGDRFNPMLRPLLGVFQGVRGAKQFRRYLSEQGHRAGAGPEVIEQALALVPSSLD
ncbi:tRNA dihydrouridine(20/20a) synthase DusA [Marinospirillum sp.]|uniref:tRNA dihydrouridine(20/20a) synthase DusA n=1 Tax=Marinospirillum sp. TaxID=2183934 RepID=UPI003A89AC31